MIKIFGFSLGKKEITQVQKPEESSFVLPQPALEDGAVTITQGAYYGTYVDLEGAVRNELELITRYREMALHPECDAAITEIVTEAFTLDKDNNLIDINLDDLKQPESIKKKITEEFKTIKGLLNFNNMGDEIFRRWYVDGRIYYHIVVDEKNPKQGIKELRYIDPRKIRKVREVIKGRDKKTGAEIINSISEYYVFNDRGTSTQTYTAGTSLAYGGVRISPDSIININSGIMDAKNVFVVSYLHKVIKGLNQLRMLEDAVVIYRLSRAPERRVFYIDVGNLPKLKAEQYLRDIMIKYRNKLVYDANTGEIRDERKHLSMLEDFWLPRREGGKGTEITTLPPGQNLGQIEDVEYFQKKLYQSLNVPISRLQHEQGGMIGLGRTTEITRDEVKFAKFIKKLRNRFMQLFDQTLKIQLALKGICTTEEWSKMLEDIHYNYAQDNNFAEMRDAELLRERITTLQLIQPFVGVYYSQQWIKKNILLQTDEDIEKIAAEIKKEPQQQDQQQIQQQDQQQDQLPAEDNTIDENPQTDSMTPNLDAEVEKYSMSKNK